VRTPLLTFSIGLMLLVSGCGTEPDQHAQQTRSMGAMPPELNNIKHKESMIVHHEGRVEGLSASDKSRYMTQVIGSMAGVQKAEVLLTGDEAYVAVLQQDQSSQGISRFLRGAIMEKLKSMDSTLRHIHIIDQPEKVERIRQLRTLLNQGHIIQQEASSSHP
jgi:Asp-tRNA(Asn)/Glu-tRNA(Gln) amidotransferase B subunit